MATKKRLNIKAAIKRPGAFSAKARKAGMSVAAFAQKHKNSKGLLGQQARFAITLRKISKKNKGKKRKKKR